MVSVYIYSIHGDSQSGQTAVTSRYMYMYVCLYVCTYYSTYAQLCMLYKIIKIILSCRQPDYPVGTVYPLVNQTTVLHIYTLFYGINYSRYP